MTKKLRITYALLFGVLFFTEIFIALFVHDGFVRPYVGDVLVTILLCCFARIFTPNSVRALPIYVFVFATLVEVAQYFNIVKLLGFENNKLLSTLIGTSFSWIDLICYAIGCIAFFGIEKIIKTFAQRRQDNVL